MRSLDTQDPMNSGVCVVRVTRGHPKIVCAEVLTSLKSALNWVTKFTDKKQDSNTVPRGGKHEEVPQSVGSTAYFRDRFLQPANSVRSNNHRQHRG